MKKTITEAELRRRVESGETHESIAKSIGHAKSSVGNACSVLGIRSKLVHRERYTDEFCLSVVRRISKGEVLSRIASEMEVRPSALFSALNRRCLPTTAAEFLRSQAAAPKLDKLTP